MKKKYKYAYSCLLILISTVYQIAAQSGNNWMSKVDGNKKITEITIPGTHDSGSRAVDVFGYAGLARNYANQTLSFKEQLNVGVRFFDIRVQADPINFTKFGDPQIVHGVIDFKTRFRKDVMSAMKSFLKENPSEFVFLSIKIDDGNESNAENQLKYVMEDSEFSSLFYNGNKRFYSWPALKNVRGKIIVVNRTNGSFGVKINVKYNTTAATASNFPPIEVQDYHNLGSEDYLDNKFDVIKSFIEEAHEDDGRKLFVNFSSAYYKDIITGKILPEILATAEYINPELNQYLNITNYNRWENIGILVTDYITRELSESIYMTNFERNSIVDLYQHAGYKGEIMRLYSSSGYVVDFNDRASSIKVLKGYMAVCYYEADYSGAYLVIPSENDDSNLTTPSWDGRSFNDAISSVKIMKKPNGVLFFKRPYLEDHTNNGGQPYVFNTRYKNKLHNSMKWGYTFQREVGDNNLISMYIGKGYKVILYENKDWTGKTLTFYAKSYDRRINDLNKWGWRDRASSVKIERVTSVLSRSQNENNFSEDDAVSGYEEITTPCAKLDEGVEDSMVKSDMFSFKVAPNPVVSGQITIIPEINTEETVLVEVLGSNGVVLNKKKLIFRKNEQASISINKNLPSRVYFLKVTIKNNNTIIKKIIKN
ncbi:phosphatidylinositol-specific phospholipase C domain-containing protein [Tenacibaculum xiamenense]|uniref:phosphatidylinositol-specific phospholipase C domain-containing protein n=1 Tax=Tenacibaculum xiamenense TaxID=1261553 RepID=UPI00389640D4